MKMLYLCLLALLSGCSIFVPPVIAIQDSPYDVEQVNLAIDDFVYKWQEEFDEDISGTLLGLTIKFIDKTEEEWYTPGCVRGLTDPYNYSYINVAYVSDYEWQIYKTALWHELTHIALGRTREDGDANHSQPPGPWTKRHDQLISQLKKNWRSKELAFKIVTQDMYFATY
jgi:hypothetical protein